MTVSTPLRKHAFTLVEILATFAIIAMLVVVATVFVASYISEARKISDKRTLLILNEALTQYQTHGGDLSALTSGASVDNVIARLKTPLIHWGQTWQFLNSSLNVNTASLAATGEGARYYFTSYASDSSSESTPSEPEDIGYQTFVSTFTNMDFESQMAGWTAAGSGNSVTTHGTDSLGVYEGSYCYVTCPAAGSATGTDDAYTNTLTSETFDMPYNDYHFKGYIGGGSTNLYVGLFDASDDSEIARINRSSSTGSWGVCESSFTLADPTTAYLKIVDSNTGSWGHMCVDAISITSLNVTASGSGFTNFSFEDQYEGWSYSGVGHQIETYAGDSLSPTDGSYAYTSALATGNVSSEADNATNELRSINFTRSAGSYTFAADIGGGADSTNLYVALYDLSDNSQLAKLYRTSSGASWGTFTDTFTLSGDTDLYIKIVDSDTGGWAHIEVDNIRVY